MWLQASLNQLHEIRLIMSWLAAMWPFCNYLFLEVKVNIFSCSLLEQLLKNASNISSKIASSSSLTKKFPSEFLQARKTTIVFKDILSIKQVLLEKTLKNWTGLIFHKEAALLFCHIGLKWGEEVVGVGDTWHINVSGRGGSALECI